MPGYHGLSSRSCIQRQSATKGSNTQTGRLSYVVMNEDDQKIFDNLVTGYLTLKKMGYSVLDIRDANIGWSASWDLRLPAKRMRLPYSRYATTSASLKPAP